jgi:hypothetical protein
MKRAAILKSKLEALDKVVAVRHECEKRLVGTTGQYDGADGTGAMVAAPTGLHPGSGSNIRSRSSDSIPSVGAGQLLTAANPSGTRQVQIPQGPSVVHPQWQQPNYAQQSPVYQLQGQFQQHQQQLQPQQQLSSQGADSSSPTLAQQQQKAGATAYVLGNPSAAYLQPPAPGQNQPHGIQVHNKGAGQPGGQPQMPLHPVHHGIGINTTGMSLNQQVMTATNPSFNQPLLTTDMYSNGAQVSLPNGPLLSHIAPSAASSPVPNGNLSPRYNIAGQNQANSAGSTVVNSALPQVSSASYAGANITTTAPSRSVTAMLSNPGTSSSTVQVDQSAGGLSYPNGSASLTNGSNSAILQGTGSSFYPLNAPGNVTESGSGTTPYGITGAPNYVPLSMPNMSAGSVNTSAPPSSLSSLSGATSTGTPVAAGDKAAEVSSTKKGKSGTGSSSRRSQAKDKVAAAAAPAVASTGSATPTTNASAPSAKSSTPQVPEKAAGSQVVPVLTLNSSTANPLVSFVPATEGVKDESTSTASMIKKRDLTISRLATSYGWTNSKNDKSGTVGAPTLNSVLCQYQRVDTLPAIPRPKTHWDFVLDEMQWMAIDFRQELRNKLSISRSLASGCAEAVLSKNEVRMSLEGQEVAAEAKMTARRLSSIVRSAWESLKCRSTLTPLSSCTPGNQQWEMLKPSVTEPSPVVSQPVEFVPSVAVTEPVPPVVAADPLGAAIAKDFRVQLRDDKLGNYIRSLTEALRDAADLGVPFVDTSSSSSHSKRSARSPISYPDGSRGQKSKKVVSSPGRSANFVAHESQRAVLQRMQAIFDRNAGVLLYGRSYVGKTFSVSSYVSSCTDNIFSFRNKLGDSVADIEVIVRSRSLLILSRVSVIKWIATFKQCAPALRIAVLCAADFLAGNFHENRVAMKDILQKNNILIVTLEDMPSWINSVELFDPINSPVLQNITFDYSWLSEGSSCGKGILSLNWGLMVLDCRGMSLVAFSASFQEHVVRKRTELFLTSGVNAGTIGSNLTRKQVRSANRKGISLGANRLGAKNLSDLAPMHWLDIISTGLKSNATTARILLCEIDTNWKTWLSSLPQNALLAFLNPGVSKSCRMDALSSVDVGDTLSETSDSRSNITTSGKDISRYGLFKEAMETFRSDCSDLLQSMTLEVSSPGWDGQHNISDFQALSTDVGPGCKVVVSRNSSLCIAVDISCQQRTAYDKVVSAVLGVDDPRQLRTIETWNLAECIACLRRICFDSRLILCNHVEAPVSTPDTARLEVPSSSPSPGSDDTRALLISSTSVPKNFGTGADLNSFLEHIFPYSGKLKWLFWFLSMLGLTSINFPASDDDFESFNRAAKVVNALSVPPDRNICIVVETISEMDLVLNVLYQLKLAKTVVRDSRQLQRTTANGDSSTLISSCTTVSSEHNNAECGMGVFLATGEEPTSDLSWWSTQISSLRLCSSFACEIIPKVPSASASTKKKSQCPSNATTTIYVCTSDSIRSPSVIPDSFAYVLVLSTDWVLRPDHDRVFGNLSSFGGYTAKVIHVVARDTMEEKLFNDFLADTRDTEKDDYTKVRFPTPFDDLRGNKDLSVPATASALEAVSTEVAEVAELKCQDIIAATVDHLPVNLAHIGEVASLANKSVAGTPENPVESPPSFVKWQFDKETLCLAWGSLLHTLVRIVERRFTDPAAVGDLHWFPRSLLFPTKGTPSEPKANAASTPNAVSTPVIPVSEVQSQTSTDNMVVDNDSSLDIAPVVPLEVPVSVGPTEEPQPVVTNESVVLDETAVMNDTYFLSLVTRNSAADKFDDYFLSSPLLTKWRIAFSPYFAEPKINASDIFTVSELGQVDASLSRELLDVSSGCFLPVVMQKLLSQVRLDIVDRAVDKMSLSLLVKMCEMISRNHAKEVFERKLDLDGIEDEALEAVGGLAVDITDSDAMMVVVDAQDVTTLPEYKNLSVSVDDTQVSTKAVAKLQILASNAIDEVDDLTLFKMLMNSGGTTSCFNWFKKSVTDERKYGIGTDGHLFLHPLQNVSLIEMNSEPTWTRNFERMDMDVGVKFMINTSTSGTSKLQKKQKVVMKSDGKKRVLGILSNPASGLVAVNKKARCQSVITYKQAALTNNHFGAGHQDSTKALALHINPIQFPLHRSSLKLPKGTIFAFYWWLLIFHLY